MLLFKQRSYFRFQVNFWCKSSVFKVRFKFNSDRLNEYVPKELKSLYFRDKLIRISTETFPCTMRIQLIFYLVGLEVFIFDWLYSCKIGY